jgi:hypothetical protein
MPKDGTPDACDCGNEMEKNRTLGDEYTISVSVRGTQRNYMVDNGCH